VLVGVGMLALGATTVRAEGGLTLEERVERLERKMEVPAPAGEPYDDSALQSRLDALEGHLKHLPYGMKLGFIAATSYMYNFNEPDSGNNSLRGFDADDNTFSLDLFQVELSRETEDGGVGFMLKLDFGKTAERLGTDWDGDGTSGNTSFETDPIDIQDAYLTYRFPGLPSFQILAGKFATLVGSELIESPLNHNISRSLGFTWSGPFTHTGVLGSYEFDDSEGDEVAKITLGLVNGWDNVIDSNDGKSVIGQVTASPIDMLTLTVNGMYGAEQADREGSKRGIVDTIAVLAPVEGLEFTLEYLYGNETDLGPTRDETVEWQSFAGIVAYDLPKDLTPMPISMALRGEYFDDSDGTRLPNPFTFGKALNAYEVTYTVGVWLYEGLRFRTEYRYDWSPNDVFEKETRGSGSFQTDQHTVAAELSYVF